MKQWYELLFENSAKKYDQERFVKGTIGECDFIEEELEYNKEVSIRTCKLEATIMIKSFLLFTLMGIGLWSTAQSSKLSPAKEASKIVEVDSSNKVEGHKLWTHNWAGYLDTTCSYSNADGLAVTIQNGKPRGEAYFDPSGRELFRVIFWYRIMNEGTTPIDLTVNFPADTYSVPPSPDSFLKLFLPPGKFTLENLKDYNYGASGLDAYLDANFDKPTNLQETIQPNEEHLFVIGTMVYKSRGQVRAELVLKGDELFYDVSIFPHFDATMFPCGKIVLKD